MPLFYPILGTIILQGVCMICHNFVNSLFKTIESHIKETLIYLDICQNTCIFFF